MANVLPRQCHWLLIILVLGAIGSGCGRTGPQEFAWEREPSVADSSALTQTVIVPTLDTPIPDGKSAIWCLSFQLAWNRLKTDLAKGPVQIQNAQVIADRLNRAPVSESDLDPSSFYAAAGFDKDGIIETIRREMAERFPGVPTPRMEKYDQMIAYAYAYLRAGVKYRFPYLDNPDEFVFTGSGGTSAAVHSFGIPPHGAEHGFETDRHQAEVLFFGGPAPQAGHEDFALDLCRFAEPNEIVVAAISRKPTLTDALAAIERNRASYQPRNPADRWIGDSEVLLVPNMHWQVTHHFRELCGADKQLLNPDLAGLFLADAEQIIDFRMDRSGAAVASQASLPAKGSVKLNRRLFVFDRPFLVLLSKRGAKQPFFVMWVDNAELLQKR
jgi:hypothetical protein